MKIQYKLIGMPRDSGGLAVNSEIQFKSIAMPRDLGGPAHL